MVDWQQPRLVRAVSRGQIVGIAVNDVIGSGVYLLPAAAAALLGATSVWAVLLAGLAVALLPIQLCGCHHRHSFRLSAVPAVARACWERSH